MSVIRMGTWVSSFLNVTIVNAFYETVYFPGELYHQTSFQRYMWGIYWHSYKSYHDGPVTPSKFQGY